MREQMRKPIRAKKKLPFLTEDELNVNVPAVKIRVSGEYFKRGEHRNDVYEEQYEAEIIVPKLFNMGHVKLMANRYVKDAKNKLKGVRVRTFYVDASFEPVPYTEKKFTVRNFISDMGLADNERNKQNYLDKIKRKREIMEAEESGEFEPDIGSVDVSSRRMSDHHFEICD